MSTVFPSSLDNFTNPTTKGKETNPDHATQHSDANDSIKALESKVGIDSSADTNSLDYKVAQKAPLIKRVNTVTDASSITPDCDTTDEYTVTALAQALTINAPSGTPNNGQKMILRFKDAGVGKALTWNAIYRIIGTTLPTTTVTNKLTYVGLIYNSADSKFDVVAVGQEI